MRTMQQGSIAMERLAEKRLAILFIRTVASSGLNNLEPEQLLATGFESDKKEPLCILPSGALQTKFP